MIELPDVTLCCLDTRHHGLAVRSLLRSMRDVRYGRVVFLTENVPSGLDIPQGVEVRRVDPIDSYRTYSEFMLKRLIEHVDTGYVLVTQWDGYVVHADAWDPAFLEFDYLGAVWPEADPGGNVGNGGFSLRSRKLLAALHDARIVETGHEDQTIGVFRPLLEREYGIRYGTTEAANRFSFEMDQEIGISGQRTFGFHGLFNFFLVESESELVALSNELSDSILKSLPCRQLLGNCYNFKQWRATIALGRRIMELDPDDFEIAEKVVDARTMLSASPPGGRDAETSHTGGFLRKFIGRR